MKTFTASKKAQLRSAAGQGWPNWHTKIKGYHHADGSAPLRAWIQFPPAIRSLLGLRPGLRCKVVVSEGRLVLKPRLVASALHPMWHKMQGVQRARFEKKWRRVVEGPGYIHRRRLHLARVQSSWQK